MIGRKPKNNYKLFIFFIAALLLVGGTFIAALIYFGSTGELSEFLRALGETLRSKGIYGVFAVFWLAVIPLLLIALIIVVLVRRKKVRSFEDTWISATELAARHAD